MGVTLQPKNMDKKMNRKVRTARRGMATAMMLSAAMLCPVESMAQECTDVVAQEYGDWEQFRVGGYGEMLATWKDYGLNRWALPYGNTRLHRSTVAVPRMTLAGDYKLNDKWVLGIEVEFEAGGTGVAYEIESGSSSENGEYETEIEKGGEVALEQFHVTRLICKELNVRVGHMVVPVGLTNAHHEPIHFFGTSRPEGETTLLPSTWHETGVEVFGEVGKGRCRFDYEAMVVAGANANGFDRYNWVTNGKQGFFEEDNFTCPAWVLRLNYRGVKGLRVGGSFYYCSDVGKNADQLVTYKGIGRIPLRIVSLDAQYANRYVTARANWLQGWLAHATELSRANKRLLAGSFYDRTEVVAKRVLTYSVEAGLNVRALFPSCTTMPDVVPFVHYTYYNPQEEGDGDVVMDERCRVSMWRMGVNWKPLPNLVVKADYSTRQIGTHKPFGTEPYNSENEFAVGVAYVGWFFKK